MSADLFAEFSQPSAPSSSARPADTSKPDSNDTINFGSAPSNSTTLSQIQWRSPQPHSSSMSGWDQPSQPPQSSHLQAPQPNQADDEDTWGDFEVAETDVTSPKLPNPAVSEVSSPNPNFHSNGAFASGSGAGWTGPPAPAPAGAIPIGDTLEAAFSQRPSAFPEPRPQSLSAAKPRSDPNVLFDADDFELQGGDDAGSAAEEEFDDFGHFESTTAEIVPKTLPKPQTNSISASLDLLGLDDTPEEVSMHAQRPNKETRPVSAALSFGAPTAYFRKSQSVHFPQQTNSTYNEFHLGGPAPKPASKGHLEKQSSESKPALPVVASLDSGDDWAAWDDPPAQSEVITSATASSADWTWGDDESSRAATQPDDNTPPPTNVPPPAVLLSSFSGLFQTGNFLLKPVAGQSVSIKQKVLSDAKASQFLQGYILLGATAARIIAGRKHRWHRDKILAKSMSISAAGSKGMKLAGVDKTQAAREDREAADVVAAWRENIGRLRSAVAAANSVGKTNIKVPEVSENMLVQTAKVVPTSAKPCVICGLKREERIAKVDYDVEDSFGEWWVEHWGHRACKNFWIEHEGKLRSR